MTFKRIDEDTVCCIVTEEDMLDNGLEVDDFLQNKDKIQEFLHTIVERAEKEVGYEAREGVLAMQVAMLPEHGVAITFSEKENFGIKDMIENIKKAVSTMDAGTTDDIFGQFEEQVRKSIDMIDDTVKAKARELQEKIKQKKATENNETKAGNKDAEQYVQRKRTGIFEFTAMKNVIKCCQSLKEDFYGNSCLVKDKDNYYLIVDNEGAKDVDFLKVCGNAIEFGKFISSAEGREAYIKEHGSVIIAKDAIAVLSGL